MGTPTDALRLLLALAACAVVSCSYADMTAPPGDASWVEPMRQVHSRFTGQKGTFAHFGDSITVSMAFWASLPYAREGASPEMERAFPLVNGYMRPECWRNWKGPQYGSEGGRTARWAQEHVQEWLGRLNPEAALIMFGTNDLSSVSPDDYVATMRDIVRRCLDNGTVVILSTIPPRGSFEEKAALFAEAVRRIALDMRVPLLDFHAQILKRRPNDWNGALEQFAQWQGYDVPTLIARDGVHPSNPKQYQGRYSEEALSNCGFALRNYLALMQYAQAIETVLAPSKEAQAARASDANVKAAPISPPHQPWFPTAPPLPAPKGEVIRVASVEQLFEAVERVKPGGTIMVADGHYMMPRYLQINTDDVTLRGESGRRERVVLDGAQSRHGELVGITSCSGVTIADLTIQNIKWNGFKLNSNTNVQRVTIYNCIIHNIWQRGVKGVSVPEQDREAMRPKGCRVQYCLFYNDRAKQFSDDPADTPENFGGDYIGGIDVMFAKGWVISDNVFIGIQGRTRSARGAIFLWQEGEDCVVERNIIIDCDTGIALGNSHRPEGLVLHCRRFIVRNNFVTRAPENGILADYTEGCLIAHNTVHDPDNRLKRLIRLVHDNEGLVVANNLLSGPPMRVETTSQVRVVGNVTRDVTDSFVSAAEGNLHLTGNVPEVTDAAPRLAEVPHDVDGEVRGDPADVGADER